MEMVDLLYVCGETSVYPEGKPHRAFLIDSLTRINVALGGSVGLEPPLCPCVKKTVSHRVWFQLLNMHCGDSVFI